MRRRGLVVVFWLTGVALGPVVGAETTTAPAPARVVTLDEALSAAESVPDVVVARAIERAAGAGVRAARTPGDVSLSLATHSVSAKESVALTVPFRWGGQRATAVEAAKAQQEAAARSRQAAVATARRECRTAWFRLAASEDRLRAAIETVDRAERNRKAVADLLDVERASRLDAARASAEAAAALAARAGAEQGVIAASADLRALMGYADERLSAGGDRPTPATGASREELRRRARASSPGVAVAEAELRAAEAQLSLRTREKLPVTSVEAGADWNDPTQPGTDALLGLSITFPTRGRAAVDAATAERDRASAEVELARRRVESDLDAARASADAARLKFEAVDGLALPAAKEAAELTRIAYAEGTLDVFRLLDAERALAEIERDRADAYEDWGVAFAQLEWLAPENRP